MIDVKDYIVKQFKFSLGNIPSVPIGTALLYALTEYGHLWYIFSFLFSFIATTLINFNVQRFLKVVRVREILPEGALDRRAEVHQESDPHLDRLAGIRRNR